jgi:RNA polymerase sigma factor (sigma-70 family)
MGGRETEPRPPILLDMGGQASRWSSAWLVRIRAFSEERVAVLVAVVHPMYMTTLTRTEVYERYADQLVRFATGIVGPSDSRDVVSAAMLGAMWSGNWAAVRCERAYLYKAVLNESRQHLRSRERRRVAELRAADGYQVDRLPEVRPEVLEAIGRLSVSQRAVVFLAYWEDMRPADIARTLGLSEGTVHRQLARAEARLRRVLDD